MARRAWYRNIWQGIKVTKTQTDASEEIDSIVLIDCEQIVALLVARVRYLEAKKSFSCA